MGEKAALIRKTREREVQALVFFLGFSVLFHGVFFAWEWLILGAGLCFLWAGLHQVEGRGELMDQEQGIRFNLTDTFLASLILLSLSGLLQPIKSSEGLLDALRWFTCWLVYRLALRIRDQRSQSLMLDGVVHAGVVLALLGWLPLLTGWSMTLDLTWLTTNHLGYANATAPFLGAVLLLHRGSWIIRLFLFLSFLNTGSRGALMFFLGVWLAREILILSFTSKRAGVASLARKAMFWKGFIPGVLLLLSGLAMTVYWNPEAYRQLSDWSLRHSLGERFLYLRDGLELAWTNRGVPRAGGWLAFPLVQSIPYWVSDPHSLSVRLLLHQGLPGLAIALFWGIRVAAVTGKKLLGSLGVLDRRGDTTLWRNASALIFLGLHAGVDADFLFGMLGLLFWLLFGMLSRQLNLDPLREIPLHRRTLSLGRRSLIILGCLFLAAGFFLEGSKGQGPLAYDQTQNTLRREVAQRSIRDKGVLALPLVEEVLSWEPFNLRAYEWAQALVLEEAERRRESKPEEALALYSWVAGITNRLEQPRVLTPLEKRLWPRYEDFRPTELNRLLAGYAQDQIGMR